VLARLHPAAREVRDDLALLPLEYTGPVVRTDDETEHDVEEEESTTNARPDQFACVLYAARGQSRTHRQLVP
jgi:hypothetical protein